MKVIKWILIVVAVVVAISIFTSKESRDEAMNRVDNAARALNGSEGERTPQVVREQQRKEWMRQNSTWTPENQKLHPIEYCQAQIEEIAKMSKQQDVALHRYLSAKSDLNRRISDAETQVKSFGDFLATAKAAYRAADATNQWPMTVNGFKLTKEKAQEKIVEAANRLPILRQSIATFKANLVKLERKIDAANVEQRALVKVRENLQTTITNIRTQQIVDGEKGITDAINALNASIEALNPDVNDVSLDDLIVPDKVETRNAAFSAIMAEP